MTLAVTRTMATDERPEEATQVRPPHGHGPVRETVAAEEETWPEDEDEPYVRPGKEFTLLAKCPHCRVTWFVTAEVVEELRQDVARQLFRRRAPQAAEMRPTRRPRRAALGMGAGPASGHTDASLYRPRLVVYDPKVAVRGTDDPQVQRAAALVHRSCGTPLMLFR
jgi:hypothetical protein